MIRGEVMNLKEFLHRQKALKLYRTILKTVRQVPDEDNQRYLHEWTRKDFRAQKHLRDTYAIQSQMKYAQALLDELQQSLQLTK